MAQEEDVLNLYDDDAQKLNEHHYKSQQTAKDSFNHAFEAGRILAEVKDRLPHGKFTAWVEARFEGSSRTARLYMQVHRAVSTGAVPKPDGSAWGYSLSRLVEAAREQVAEPEPEEPAAPREPASEAAPEPEYPEWEEEVEGEEFIFGDEEKNGEADAAQEPEPTAPEEPALEEEPASTAPKVLEHDDADELLHMPVAGLASDPRTKLRDALICAIEAAVALRETDTKTVKWAHSAPPGKSRRLPCVKDGYGTLTKELEKLVVKATNFAAAQKQFDAQTTEPGSPKPRARKKAKAKPKRVTRYYREALAFETRDEGYWFMDPPSEGGVGCIEHVVDKECCGASDWDNGVAVCSKHGSRLVPDMGADAAKMLDISEGMLTAWSDIRELEDTIEIAELDGKPTEKHAAQMKVLQKELDGYNRFFPKRAMEDE